VNYRYVSALWHQLMTALGYERYGAGGGDFGAGVCTLMALDKPGPIIGIHLTSLGDCPVCRPGLTAVIAYGRAYVAMADRWWQSEGGL